MIDLEQLLEFVYCVNLDGKKARESGHESERNGNELKVIASDVVKNMFFVVQSH